MPWSGALLLLIGITALISMREQLFAGLLCMMGVYFVYSSFALRRYFKKRYRTDQRYKDNFTADISEDGIHFSTPSVDSQMKWSGIVRYLESDKIFMLFHAALIFSIIPKRAFAPGEADTFRDLLRRNTRVQE